MTTPSLSETIEWIEQYHWRASETGVEDFCSNCGGKWPCTPKRLSDTARSLRESLECLLHRCETEGCGTAWAPIQDAKKLLEDMT